MQKKGVRDKVECIAQVKVNGISLSNNNNNNNNDEEARGGVVIKALCYEPEGRGFETR
jgi:hypothetical protein